MNNKWYWAFKYIFFGPALRLWNRPWTKGMENIPARGPAILVSNHQSVMDSFFFPLMCPRQITFLAKSEYFNTPGLVGRTQAWFFKTVGQMPVERGADTAAEGMISAARKVLDKGDLFGIYPEGTRSPDGRVYRGRTGMARLAMSTGVEVVPLVMFGTREANPIGTWVPRPKKVGMKVGEPIDPLEWAKARGLDPGTRETAREFTDFVMGKLVELSGHSYVDMYASDVKASLNAGHGYPDGAEPGGIRETRTH